MKQNLRYSAGIIVILSVCFLKLTGGKYLKWSARWDVSLKNVLKLSKEDGEDNGVFLQKVLTSIIFRYTNVFVYFLF